MKTGIQRNRQKTLEKFRKQNERSERQHVLLFEGANPLYPSDISPFSRGRHRGGLRLSLERAACAVKFCRNFSSVLIFSLLLSFVSRQKKVKSYTITCVWSAYLSRIVDSYSSTTTAEIPRDYACPARRYIVSQGTSGR